MRSLLVGMLLFAGSTSFAQTLVIQIYENYPATNLADRVHLELECKNACEVEGWTNISCIVPQSTPSVWGYYTLYHLSDLVLGEMYSFRARLILYKDGVRIEGDWGGRW